MATKSRIKKVRPEPVAVLHICSEEVRIKKIEQLLVGNGKPEEGYIYKVMEIGNQVKDINSKLTGISGVVNELHEESVGNKAIDKKSSKTLTVALQVAGVLITLGMLYLGYKNLIKNSANVERRIDDLGVPVVTNKRGEMLILPDSARILYLYNDSLKYVIKKDK